MLVGEQIKEFLSDKLSSLDVEIYDCVFKKEGKDYYLHISVEKKNGDPISLDEIVKTSEIIGPLLDESDIIKINYILDVSSLGAERPLKIEELPRFVNKYINIHVTNPIEGMNILEGDLIECKDDYITLGVRVKTRTKNYEIKKSTIDRARLAIKF